MTDETEHNALTPDEAVAALMGDTDGGDSPARAEDEDEQPVKDDAAEVADDDGDADDGSEGDTDETDETDDEAEAEEENAEADEADEDDEEPGETLYDVKVDGEVRKVSLQELRNGYAGQETIKARLTQLNTTLKDGETAVQRVTEAQQKLDRFMQALNQGHIPVPPSPPDESLWQQDPMGYLDAERQFKRAHAEYEAQMGQIQQAVEQARQAQAEAHRVYVAREREALAEAIPELRDEAKAPEVQKALFRAAEEAGFTADDLKTLTDHRAWKVLNKARLYDELMASREQAKAKKVKAKTPLKPRGQRPAEPRANRNKALKEVRTKKTPDAAMNALIQLGLAN